MMVIYVGDPPCSNIYIHTTVITIQYTSTIYVFLIIIPFMEVTNRSLVLLSSIFESAPSDWL